MRKFTKPDLPREHERRFWRAIRAGMTLQEATDSAGASLGWGSRLLAKAGGVNPAKTTEPSGERYLRFEEREEIMRLQASGLGVRAIAREIDRNPSTVSRELKRAVGVRGYRASMAQTHADRGRRGPHRRVRPRRRSRRPRPTRTDHHVEPCRAVPQSSPAQDPLRVDLCHGRPRCVRVDQPARTPLPA